MRDRKEAAGDSTMSRARRIGEEDKTGEDSRSKLVGLSRGLEGSEAVDVEADIEAEKGAEGCADHRRSKAAAAAFLCDAVESASGTSSNEVLLSVLRCDREALCSDRPKSSSCIDNGRLLLFCCLCSAPEPAAGPREVRRA